MPCLFLLGSACGGGSDGGGAATNAPATEPSSGFGDAPGSNGGSGTTSTTHSADANEQCPNAGATRTCCTTGTQTCSGSGEFNTWAACVDKSGAPLTCNGEKDPPKPVDVDAGVDSSTYPPPSACGAVMACKPGAIRYCDTKIAEWTKATCTAQGQWGPCVETTAPDGKGCDPDSYSPEKCCPGLKLCCQDNSGGPFVDFGSGACAAISCK